LELSDNLYDEDDRLAVTVWLQSPTSYVLVLMHKNRWTHLQICNSQLTQEKLDKEYHRIHWRDMDDFSFDWMIGERWVVLPQSDLLNWLVSRTNKKGFFITYG
jgi:hypothetical protein